MPDYVYNTVTIVGNTRREVKSVISHMTTDLSQFDFNALISMPKSITATYDEQPLDVLIRTGTEDERKRAAVDLQELKVNNVTAYGFEDWYGWSCEHWGVKWNAGEVQWTPIEQLVKNGSCRATCKFNTAWAAPAPVAAAFRKKFPDMHVAWTARYEEDLSREHL